MSFHSITAYLGFFIVLTTIISPALASSTQQYNKIFLNPFYRESLTSATNYTYTITVNPPDGIKSIVSAIFSFNAQINGQTQGFTLWVDGKSCNNRNYTVATAYSTTGNVQFYFDCSNVITKAGNYTITMKSSVNTGAMIGWLDLTYMNNPPSMTTSGTEYSQNENGRVFLRLLDGNENPINLGTCNTTIYYPNNTKLINNQQMTLLEKGYYYYDFTTPNITGNYIVGFDCIFPTTIWRANTSLIGVILDSTVNDYESFIPFDDTNNYTINNAWLTVQVSNSIAGANLGINFNGKKVGSLTGSSGILTGNYTINQSDFFLGEAQVYTLTHDGSGTNSPIYIYLFVNYTNDNPQQIIRGQNEMHIGAMGSTIANISTQLSGITLSYLNQQFNQTWNNQTRIYNYQVSSNASITTSIANTNTSLSTQLYNTNTSLGNQIGNVQTTSNTIHSNLASFNASTNSSLLTILNNQQTIYNYQQSSNASLSNQISNVPNNVWNYPVRNLTYYPALNVTADVNYTYFNEKFSGINSTMTTYYNALNSILISVNNTANYLYDWFEYRVQWVS